jgi:hypothetical protein
MRYFQYAALPYRRRADATIEIMLINFARYRPLAYPERMARAWP